MRWLAGSFFCLLVIALAAQSSTTIDSLHPLSVIKKQGKLPSQLISQNDSINANSMAPPDYSPASNKKKLDQFLEALAAREKDYRRQLYIRWGLGIAFTAALIFILVRKRKQGAKD